MNLDSQNVDWWTLTALGCHDDLGSDHGRVEVHIAVQQAVQRGLVDVHVHDDRRLRRAARQRQSQGQRTPHAPGYWT